MRITSEDQYREALERVNTIFGAAEGSTEGQERDALVAAIMDHEDREYPEFRRARGDTRLVLLAGPSGVGKDAIIEQVRKADPGVHIPVTATTRTPREGEEDGREYHFLDEAGFLRMEEAGSFLETACVHGHRYGTPRAEVEGPMARGMDVLLKIDVQGAAIIRGQMPHALDIFIMPDGMSSLEKRLSDRGLEQGDLETRLENAHREIARGYREFRKTIVNREGQLEQAVREVIRAMREG